MSAFVIAKKTLTSNSGLISIANIPGTYNNLLLHISLTGTSSLSQFPTIKFNNSTANEYCQTWTFWSSPSTYSSKSALRDYIGASITNTDNGGSKFSNQIIQINDYARTDRWKNVLSIANDESKTYGGGTNAIWKNTSAITSLQVYLVNGEMGVGSKVTLIGVK